MKDRHASQYLARIIYFVEVLIFAAPVYLTYGLFAAYITPFAMLLVLSSPFWFVELFSDWPDGDTKGGIVFLLAAFALALSMAGFVSLWKLAKLSYVYLTKGENELSRHKRDFRVGLHFAILPLIATTTSMDADLAKTIELRAEFPLPLPIRGWFVLIPATHLWLSMRRSKQDSLSA